ncbi:conserved hypothetical protein [Ricinus communis]|uniref:RNase H type-1 domain-containing protein n=1 Tax=Ricinus communis TaxID=3988 RepID=B9S3R2_RICCO|nr:conserved hypothetical protein [Ricinus communis]
MTFGGRGMALVVRYEMMRGCHDSNPRVTMAVPKGLEGTVISYYSSFLVVGQFKIKIVNGKYEQPSMFNWDKVWSLKLWRNRNNIVWSQKAKSVGAILTVASLALIFFRDHEGSFIASFQQLFLSSLSPREAEAIGVKEALSWLKNKGVDRVIMESDAKSTNSIAYKLAKGSNSLSGLVEWL